MKNLIIGPAFPLRGGIANFNEALCRAFIKSGADSSIVSFSLQYPGFLFPGKTQFDTSGKTPDGIKITTLINSINPINWYKTALYIKKQKPDFIIIRYWLPFMAPCLGTIARLVKKNSGIKIIALCDNVIPHEKRAGDNMLTKYFVRQCDGFVAMSKSVLEDLKKIAPELKNKTLKFLPHPIYDIFGSKVSKDEARNQLGLKQEEKYILFFGFIRRYKGLDLLLEAMADERIKNSGIKLIVAGEFYEDRTPYIEFIKKNKLENNIILRTEFIPAEQVKYYFCAADMVVQPYRTATQSGVTQIAYHYERPMLVTRVGGLPEIVPDQVVGYVTDVSAEAVSNAVLDFYLHKREEEFSANAAHEKLRFSWENFVKGVEELLASLR